MSFSQWILCLHVSASVDQGAYDVQRLPGAAVIGEVLFAVYHRPVQEGTAISVGAAGYVGPALQKVCGRNGDGLDFWNTRLCKHIDGDSYEETYVFMFFEQVKTHVPRLNVHCTASLCCYSKGRVMCITLYSVQMRESEKNLCKYNKTPSKR